MKYARFGLILLLLCMMARLAHCATPSFTPAPGVNAPVVVAVSAIPWVRWFKADAITPVADASTIASWVDSAGSGDPAVQATGASKPAYKIAANGINGVPVVRFTGSQFMQTVHGGVSLKNAFYYAIVAKASNTGTTMLICAGEEGTGKRRGILLRSSSYEFQGFSADAAPVNAALVTNTPYLVEVLYDGSYVYIAINGVQQGILVPGGSGLVSYTGDAITLGGDNAGAEGFSGDVAEVMCLNSWPTRAQQQSVETYVAGKYALSMPVVNAVPSISGKTLSNSQTVTSAAVTQILGPVVIGSGLGPILVGFLDNADLYPAAVTIRGSVAIDATGANADGLTIRSNVGAGNPVCIWSTTSSGYSAARFRSYDGHDRGGYGFANPNSNGPFSYNSNGSNFIEAQGLDGTFTFVMTGSALNTGAQTLRLAVDTNGNFIFFDGTAAKGAVKLTLTPAGAIVVGEMSAPGTPSSGVAVYVDSVDHKLKAKGSSGTITVLANP